MFILALAFVAQNSGAQPVETAPAQGALLWREFRAGMSPEQVAEKLRAIDGIRSVTVERGRKDNKPPTLSIAYTDSGVAIGAWKVSVATTFSGEKLSEIELSNLSCQAAAIEQAKLVAESLREKYGNRAPERVVDDNGVTIDRRMAFWNSETRVRMSAGIVAPTSDQQVYGEGKVGNALAGLANLMSSASRDADMKACPTDNGYRLKSTVNYSAQSAFLAEQGDIVAKRAANAKATKDGL